MDTNAMKTGIMVSYAPMKSCWLALCLAICGIASAETNHVVRTAAELRSIISRTGLSGMRFELRATALSHPPGRRYSFFAMDESCGVPIFDIRMADDPHFEPGDRLLISGVVEPRHSAMPEDMLRNANCTNVVVLAHGKPPEPTAITAGDIERDDLLYRPVRTSGILIDVRKDEIDPRFIQFTLACSNNAVVAAGNAKYFKGQEEFIKRLSGATIEINGVLSQHTGLRIHCRRFIALTTADSIRMLKKPSDDLFRVPEIGDTDGFSPEAIIALGHRRAIGRVLAVWNGDTLLMRATGGKTIKVTLSTSPPSVGDCIEAVGYAETDLFHVNLANATWRKTDVAQSPADEIADVEPKTLLADESGNRRFDYVYHGKTVRIRGIVQDMTSDGRTGRRMIVSSGGYAIAVDVESVPDAVRGIEIGSTVSVTGVCILETETWNRHSVLPRTFGLFISVRSPEDIVVIATPPWWTPARLMSVIGVLSLLLVAILVWNASLRTLSERRGREIYRGKIEQAKTELRLDERTRLAAELHDHLAQNLTAVSYQIAAADRSRTVDAEASARHIANAARMLGSSRTELRRCLWDLRSDALNESDVAQAIMKSMGPVVGEAKVSVRFKAIRSKISDSALHAMLSIIRELAANAVNHGCAQTISVDGSLTHGTLSFSVSDDGCGFDTEHAPGVDDGHFGLAGVRERVRRHGGEVSIKSSKGTGTNVSIILKAGIGQ